MNTFIVSSFLAVTVGFIVNMYNGVAENYGWPIGKLFTKSKGWIIFIGWLCIVSGGIELISRLHLLWGIISLIISFVTAILLIRIFKKNIQWISALILLASAVIWVVGGIEFVKY